MMKNSPMKAIQALDLYFLDNRARMLEIASFLDRIDRYENSSEAKNDYRYLAFYHALKIILETDIDRTGMVQELFSDMSAEPVDRVFDGKAYGAWKGADIENH